MKTKLKPPTSDEPRTKVVKFYVNAEEHTYLANLAAKAGMRMTDYLRSRVSLMALTAGAPAGNRNRAGKTKSR